jgi:hypothetical protein
VDVAAVIAKFELGIVSPSRDKCQPYSLPALLTSRTCLTISTT